MGGERELHFIVDNFSTQKHKDVVDWLEGYKTVHLHFTPTRASWLNQMELWFSLLVRQLLSKKDFKTIEDLTRQVLQFIEEYNKTSKPFAWTYKGKLLTIN